MAEGDGSSGSTAHFNTAAVHIVFQTRPGTVANRRITTAGDATLTLHSGAVSQVQPVEGIYHFDMPVGETAILELFGTQYNVIRVNGTDPDPTGERTIVVWDGALRPNTNLEGALQRLQILGYHHGAVTDAMNDLAEQAILQFQADHGLVIDGVAGSNTRTKINQIFSSAGHMPGGQQPLNRRYLAYFERANAGATRRDSPQIDFRGGEAMKLSLPAPVAGEAPSPVYKLGCFPINLDESSFPWHLTAHSGNGTVSVTNSIMTTYNDRFEFSAVATGDEVLEMHQGAADGPIIASLDVKVVALMQVDLWGHLLTVRDAGGAELADPPNWTEAEARSLIDRINDIWNPAGVRFVFRAFESHTLDEAQAGMVADDYVHNHIRSSTIARRLNRSGVMNIYFTQLLSMTYHNADGVLENSTPLAHAGNRWAFNPSAVFSSKGADMPMMGRVLAHEFGHMLKLTRAQYAHTDDRGVATPWRHDLWSRMRLMSKYVNYDTNDPDRWWQDLTYGTDENNFMLAGDLVSVKDLPNDGTDGELARSHTSITNRPYPARGIAIDA